MDVQAGGPGFTLLNQTTPGGVGLPPKRGTRELMLAYQMMPWLRAICGRIGTSVAATEWKLFVTTTGGASGAATRQKALQRAGAVQRRALLKAAQDSDSLREVTDHPLLDLLDSANPFQTGQGMRRTTQVHLDLVGEAFWMKERNGLGAPTAVWPIPPDWILSTPTPSRRTFRVSYRAWQGEIPDTEILWFLDPDPANPYGRGSGTAMALTDELETDEYAAKHTKAMFYNKARPDVLITADGLSDPQTTRLERDWLLRNTGFWRAFKPYFINKKVDVHEFDTNDLRSMQFTQLREHERDTIIHVFGVPPEILGILENSNRSTIDAADFLFSTYVLVPRLEFLRTTLQERLVPEFDERLILDYASPVKTDSEFALKVATAAPWAKDVDEWRAMMGDAPLPNDRGKVHMVPNLLTPVRDLGAEADAPPPVPPPVPPTPPATPPPPPAPKARRLTGRDAALDLQDARTFHEVGVTSPTLRAATDEAQTRLLRAVDPDTLTPVSRIAARLQPKLRAIFLRAWESARERVNVDALADALVSGQLGQAEALLRLTELAKELDPKVRRVLTQGVSQGAEATAELLAPYGISVDFTLVNDFAVTWAATQTGTLITETTTEAINAMRWLTATAFEDGRPVRQLAQDLREWFGLRQDQYAAVLRFRADLEAAGVAPDTIVRRVNRYADAQRRYRASMIAQTESATAAHEGQMQLWAQGIETGELDPATMRRLWITSGNDNVCEAICQHLDGETAKWGQPFKVPAGPKKGTTYMGPPTHPVCHCDVGLTFTDR